MMQGCVLLGQGKGDNSQGLKAGWQEKPAHDGSREAGPLPLCWRSCVMLSPDQLKVGLPQSGSLHIVRRFELELNM